MLLKRATT